MASEQNKQFMERLIDTIGKAISADGKFLYTLNSGTGTINIFGINQDGSLTGLGDVGGQSASAGMNGIAAI